MLSIVSKFCVSCTTSGKKMSLTDRLIAGRRIDGRGVGSQVPPAHWPADVAFQHVTCRTCLY
jgi:hypothetical protein